MKFKNLNCEDAKEMGAKVRELTDIVCRKCDKHSDLVETINLQRSAIKQRDTEIDILIRKKEALRDEIEELKLKISELEIKLKEKSLWDNLQKAEVERLQKENHQFADIGKMYSEVRADAIKDVLLALEAEALSSDKYISEYDDCPMQRAFNKGLWDMYNLVKEMTEGEE